MFTLLTSLVGVRHMNRVSWPRWCTSTSLCYLFLHFPSSSGWLDFTPCKFILFCTDEMRSFFYVQMYRFTVHAVHKSKTQSSLWTPLIYTFGHKDLAICRTWASQISSCLKAEAKRPKGLLVCPNLVKIQAFIHITSILFFPCRLKTDMQQQSLCFSWLDFWSIRFLFIRGVGKDKDVKSGKQ